MKIYTVLISFAAMLFLGSDQVHGSNLHPGARDGTLELEPSSNTTTTANADHRSLLRATKKKTWTRFYGCKSRCFNRDDKKRCRKKCTVKGKINRAFCLNSRVPPMCRECCEREDDTDPNPDPTPDPGRTDPPLVGCLNVCSNINPKMKCDPTECSLCKPVGDVQNLCMPDCGEKCGSDSHCVFAHGCSKCIDGECRPPPPPPPKKIPTKYYGCNHNCFLLMKECRERCTIKTLDFRAFRAFCVNGHLPKMCRGCCKYPSSSNPEPEPEPEPQVHSSGQFQIGWDAGKPHDSG